MVIPYKEAAVKAMQFKELRQAIRRDIPELRGNFCSSASRQLMEEVLTGVCDPVQALRLWEGAQDGSKCDIKELESGPVDVAKEHGATDMGGLSDADMIQRTIAALEMIDPKFGRVVATLAELAAANVQKAMIEEDMANLDVAEPNAPVKIGGTTMVCIGHHEESIPDCDASYDFSAWRAQPAASGWSSGVSCGVGDFCVALLSGIPIYIWGERGVGKTSLVREVCARARWPYTQIQCRNDMTAHDFFGHWVAKGGETHWVDGQYTKARREGHVVLLDEADKAAPEVMLPMYAPLQAPLEPFYMPGEDWLCEVSPNHRIVASGNTSAHMDTSGEYVASRVQDKAMMDRYGAGFRVIPPTTGKIATILQKKTGIDKPVAKSMAEVSKLSRSAECDEHVTMRQCIAWAQLCARGMTVSKAYAISVLNKLNETSATALAEVAERVFGGDVFNGAWGDDDKLADLSGPKEM